MGSAYCPTIKNVKISGEVNGSGVQVGGLAGSVYDCNLEYCYFNGTVRSTGSEVGGLTGSSDDRSVIKKCMSNCLVMGYSQCRGTCGTYMGNN